MIVPPNKYQILSSLYISSHSSSFLPRLHWDCRDYRYHGGVCFGAEVLDPGAEPEVALEVQAAHKEATGDRAGDFFVARKTTAHVATAILAVDFAERIWLDANTAALAEDAQFTVHVGPLAHHVIGRIATAGGGLIAAKVVGEGAKTRIYLTAKSIKDYKIHRIGPPHFLIVLLSHYLNANY
jgi:hypothetical protein